MEEYDTIVVRFAGDSGDGMQTVGEQFSDNSVLAGYDISTFPDFPAEIRAPAGTLPGISGFQVHFGGGEIRTPGDAPDAFVAMNPAALKVNLPDLKSQGLLIINTGAFTADNLKKAGYESDPLEDETLAQRYRLLKLDLTQMTMDALAESEMRKADKGRCKNFLALGLVYFVYGRSLDNTLKWLEQKWGKKPLVMDANVRALKAGYYFGETAEVEVPRYRVLPTAIKDGVYRKISGNEAAVLGLVAASELSYRDIVLGSYPITPASSILEGFAQLKHYNVKTVQAEDEIAAVGVAIGASFTGGLGVTSTSGPGLCLKAEFVGLAVIAELPLVIVNVQRGGPSTGLPTKTEQADLLQTMFGRNGESPLAVVAARSPSDCFHAAIEAARIALTYNTPVILLSDGYIANGAEPWRVPSVKRLPNLVMDPLTDSDDFKTYERDEKTLARRLAFPGRKGFEHRIGGIEKDESGNVSYDPANHQKMTDLRAAKIERIADSLPPTEIVGDKTGKVLVLGWGGTQGAIVAGVERMRAEGKKVSAVVLRHLNPFPKDLGEILDSFDEVLIPELNCGQLCMLIRAKFLIDAHSLSKVQGRPFSVTEITDAIGELL